jgi:hypothetical protein
MKVPTSNAPRARAACLALGLLLALPALWGRFAADDYFHIGHLEGGAPISIRSWELFTFVPGDPARYQALVHSGYLPWWSSPRLKLAFFRPLSSELVALDHALFGRHALGWHVHSLLWWAALLWATGRLYGRVLPAGTALVGLLLFAIDDSHWMPIGWSAARNGMVAAVPAVLGLLGHIRWREHRWRPGVILGPLGFAVGLAGGEAAVGMLAYVVSYEVLGAPRGRSGRLVAIAPYAGLLLVYGVVRAGVGVGAIASDSYVDPLSQPLAFATAAAGRVPALAGALVFGAPPELWVGVPRLQPALVAIGLAGLGLVVLWLRRALPARPSEERRGLAWLAGGAILALVPAAGGMLGDRVLLPASIGAAPVFAALLEHGLGAWRAARGRRRRGLVGLALVAIGLPNAVLAAPLLVGKLVLWSKLAGAGANAVCRAPLEGPGPVRAVVAWDDDPAIAVFGGATRRFHCPGEVASWMTLSMAPEPHTLTRTAPAILTLEAPEGALLASEWERVFRTHREPAREGDTVTLDGGLAITVEETRRGRPVRIRVTFPAPLEGGDFRLLRWHAGRLEPLELPAIGARVELGRR